MPKPTERQIRTARAKERKQRVKKRKEVRYEKTIMEFNELLIRSFYDPKEMFGEVREKKNFRLVKITKNKTSVFKCGYWYMFCRNNRLTFPIRILEAGPHFPWWADIAFKVGYITEESNTYISWGPNPKGLDVVKKYIWLNRFWVWIANPEGIWDPRFKSSQTMVFHKGSFKPFSELFHWSEGTSSLKEEYI